jgi:8-amino-7-oxononanoate synthase
VNHIEIDELLSAALQDLRDGHRYRQRRPVKVLDTVRVEIAGKILINFASNNYLGLTHHPAVLEAARTAMESSGYGSGAAPLVTGHTQFHADAEKAIATWKGTQDAVLFPSGFQANQAAISAVPGLAGRRGVRVRFLIDKLSHASLIDAVRSTGDYWRTFPHNNTKKLRTLLSKSALEDMTIVITESIFSMDGDAADLRSLASLKQEIPFLLILDEAHASGVYGPGGSGLASELGVSHAVDLSIVTLSKALGGIGGAICGSANWCRSIVNFARSYIFSTALPAAAAAAATAAISVMAAEPHRQQRVRELAKRVRRQLSAESPPSDSPIIPVILGSESKAMEISEKLQENGLLVPAIRPPTVARGTSRLRITLSCEHTDEQVERLLDVLTKTVGNTDSH